MIARLKRYVGLRSISGEEHAIGGAVYDDLREAGLDVQRRGNNVWCALGDQPRPRLLLNAHLDTVPPGDGWSGDPCELRRTGDRLVGLGANDAKGCVVALIEAVLRLKTGLDGGRRLGGTAVLALTAEEETSGAGLGTILDELRPLDAAIVGEPTSMTPMIAQRGLLILRGVARGRSAHPAGTTPDRAENAVLTAAAELLRLRDFDWGPTHALLGRCHGHVTMIRGGVARNVIPDACEFYLDVRTTPAESHSELYERLRRYLRCELRIHSDRLVPTETDAGATIVEAVQNAIPGALPAGSPAMSDMVYLRGTPSVKIGPGDSSRSHTPDEYVLAEELQAGAEGYQRTVREYFDLVARASDDSTAVCAQTKYPGGQSG